MPDLPIPQTITLPSQFNIAFTIFGKTSSTRCESNVIASASISNTSFAQDTNYLLSIGNYPIHRTSLSELTCHRKVLLSPIVQYAPVTSFFVNKIFSKIIHPVQKARLKRIISMPFGFHCQPNSVSVGCDKTL
jgi:hypothetical protein